jgi:adhesin transport system outer membrane protein
MGLDQLIAAALSSHPAAQVQLSLEESARADVDSANWQFYPTLSLAIENARTGELDPSSPGDSMVSILRLQQPLWAGGRLTAGLDKAEAGVIASQASVAETREQLALRVVQAYGDWLAAKLKLLAYEKSRVTHVRLRDQVKRRIEQGASAKSDLTLAVSRLQSVVAEYTVARAQMDIALTRLGQLLGKDVSTLKVAIVDPRPVIASAQQLLDMAFAVSPALRRAQAETQVQKAVIAERRANLSPEVFLRVERQYGNPSIRNADPEDRIVLGVDSRFGAGLSSLSNVKGAKAQYQAALAEVDVQRRAVSESVLSDYALANSSKVRLDALRASLNAAKQVSVSYDRQFLAGRKTWLDVMNAARELAQTEAQLADIQSAQVVVTWRLDIYTRGLGSRGNLPSADGQNDKSLNQLDASDSGLAGVNHADEISCWSDQSVGSRHSVCLHSGQWYPNRELLVSDVALGVRE